MERGQNTERGVEWERLGAGETVDFEHTDLEVTARAERGIVERQATVRLAVADILVHPDSLSFPATHDKIRHLATYLSQELGVLREI